ncbi:MAG: GNAT family N-acetyltransferase [Acidobacteria bacterium]|nr:GNAT family N-acetyltransferase [Acidobacteriota bacterium]
MTARHPADLELRSATADDVELIHRLILELAEYEKRPGEAVVTALDLHRTLFGPRPYAEVILARYRGELAGFALFFHNFSTFQGQPGIYLEDLYVREAHRRFGVGKALMARLAELAVERGCGRLDWTVLDWNQGAIDFYHRLGARAFDEWRHFRLTGDALTSLAAGAQEKASR